MRSVMVLSALALLALAACNSSSTGLDALPDSGMDAGSAPRDVGTLEDAAALPDVGPVDAGFGDPATFLEGIVELAGLPTYVLMMGTKTSTMPPLVVVPTGPAFAHEYLLPHMKAFLPGRMMVFFDERGTGDTSYGTGARGSTLTAGQDAIDLENVVDLARTTAGNVPKVDIIGHGYGAAVASMFAAHHPEKINRLILVTPFPATVDQYVAYQGEIASRITGPELERFNALTNRPECRGNPNRCYLQVWQMYGPHYLCPQNVDHFADLNFTNFNERTDDYVERQLLNIRYTWTGTLAQVRARTTVVVGPCTPFPAETADSYSTLIPGAMRYDIATSGYFPMVEAKDEFNAIVRQALIYP